MVGIFLIAAIRLDVRSLWFDSIRVLVDFAPLCCWFFFLLLSWWLFLFCSVWVFLFSFLFLFVKNFTRVGFWWGEVLLDAPESVAGACNVLTEAKAAATNWASDFSLSIVTGFFFSLKRICFLSFFFPFFLSILYFCFIITIIFFHFLLSFFNE